MASVFTRIIDGELPGRFVWRDDDDAERIRAALRELGHSDQVG